jgi:hypothetical protein
MFCGHPSKYLVYADFLTRYNGMYMRVTDTRKIYDGSKALLSELYATRVGKPLYELNRLDLSNLAVRRAITELKMYHLPPMFEVPSDVRSRMPLVEEFDMSTWYDRRTVCQRCGKLRQTYRNPTHDSVLCLPCHDDDLRDGWSNGERPWGHSEFRSCAAEFHEKLRETPYVRPKDSTVELWSNPKVTFLACEVGCRVCGEFLNWRTLGWFWSADSEGWADGACSACQEFAPGWFEDSRLQRTWQDEYTAIRRLHRTIERYGTLSLLLVNPSPYWANWLTTVLPTGGTPTADPRLGKMIAHLRMPRKRPRTVADLGISVKDVLRPDPIPKGQVRIYGEE